MKYRITIETEVSFPNAEVLISKVNRILQVAMSHNFVHNSWGGRDDPRISMPPRIVRFEEVKEATK